MSSYDYTGKMVYVGIDVHKKTFSCVSICEGKAVKRDSMPAKSEVLLNRTYALTASGNFAFFRM